MAKKTKRVQRAELIEQIGRQLQENPLLWGKFYFPHYFRKRSPKFHVKILRESLRNRYLGVASPRESAKSTILAFLRPFHAICYKERHFIILVSNTFKKAAESLENIKIEMRENEQIKTNYNIEFRRDTLGDTIFRHPDGFETRFLCKGSDQIGTVRGERFGAWRPDMIIGDDIEDDEMVRSPERRIQLADEINHALMFAGDRERCVYIFIGTILHDDSFMAKIVSPEHYTDFRKLKYVGRFPNDPISGKSLWKEKWTIEELNKMEQDDPVAFAKEIQNDPVSGLLAKFRREDFRYWRMEDRDYCLYGDENQVIARDSLRHCKPAIACDLAWEEKRQADYTVIMPGFLTPDSYLLIDDYIFRKGLRPDEIEEILFTMEDRLRRLTGSSVPIGFEKAKLEKVMKWLLRNAMRRRNHYLIFKELMWDNDKITRIVTRLQSRYAQHSIFHRRNMGDLEHQLLRVPSGTHDDLPDALQGIVQLLTFPKTIKQETKVEDPGFEKLRKFAIESRKPKKTRYVFGKKVTPFPFATIKSL